MARISVLPARNRLAMPAAALYGVLLIWHGGARTAEVDRAVGEGRFAAPVPWISSALGAIGIGLGLATGVLILAG